MLDARPLLFHIRFCRDEFLNSSSNLEKFDLALHVHVRGVGHIANRHSVHRSSPSTQTPTSSRTGSLCSTAVTFTRTNHACCRIAALMLPPSPPLP